jgi:PEP-CTERM motif
MMTLKPLAALALILCSTSAFAQTQTVADPVGDFLPSYTGPLSPSLDVTSFTVTYNGLASSFLLSASLAGPVSSAPGFYVIGVNTGTGTLAPFASIGEPNVIFNQAIAIQPTGTATIGQTQLAPGSVFINGNAFSALIPLALLPSTGFAPQNYGFNLWPRSGSGQNAQISDFAPQNANLAAAAVPEPGTWAMMLMGFGVIGASMRRRRRPIAQTILFA